MGKSVAESDKAKEYERRAEYWEERASKIDLSMPDCLEYFEFELDKANKNHQYLLDNPDKRPHSMSLQYSNKNVKDLQDKVATAIRLWGSDEDIQQLANEKRDEAEKASKKTGKAKDRIEKHHGFFAFNNDQFTEGYNNLKENGLIQEGEKVIHIKAGLYMPKNQLESYLNSKP